MTIPSYYPSIKSEVLKFIDRIVSKRTPDLHFLERYGKDFSAATKLNSIGFDSTFRAYFLGGFNRALDCFARPNSDISGPDFGKPDTVGEMISLACSNLNAVIPQGEPT